MEPTKNATNSLCLLDLPAELRNDIYRLAMVTDTRIELVDNSIRQKHTTLLQTCRQIRAEATAMFYAENRFKLTTTASNLPQILGWAESLPIARAQRFKSVLLEFNMCAESERYVQTYQDRTDQPGKDEELIEKYMAIGRTIARALADAGVPKGRNSAAVDKRPDPLLFLPAHPEYAVKDSFTLGVFEHLDELRPY